MELYVKNVFYFHIFFWFSSVSLT